MSSLCLNIFCFVFPISGTFHIPALMVHLVVHLDGVDGVVHDIGPTLPRRDLTKYIKFDFIRICLCLFISVYYLE